MPVITVVLMRGPHGVVRGSAAEEKNAVGCSYGVPVALFGERSGGEERQGVFMGSSLGRGRTKGEADADEIPATSARA